MKKLITVALLLITCSITGSAQQDKAALKLADAVAAAFSNDLRPLDKRRLSSGKLQVQLHSYVDDDGKYRYRSFKSFAALASWLKREENEPGFPVRTSGEKVSCRSGLCRLELVDGQMMHNHVYLTRIWYGRNKRGLYVKKVRLLYG